MANLHSFASSLAFGHLAEAALDAFFSGWFAIENVSAEDDHAGIDRVFKSRSNPGVRTPIQYKADAVTGRTLNAFIEVVSVDYKGSPGWAFTRRARILVYWAFTLKNPAVGNLLVIPMHAIGSNLGKWMGDYEIKPALNEGYRTWGICVPWIVLCTTCVLGFPRQLEPSAALLDASKAHDERSRP